MKMELKKKIWEFVKKFPATSYGISGIMVLITSAWCVECVERLGFILIPFFLAILLNAGFLNFISSLTSSMILCLVIFPFFFAIFPVLDLLTHLLRKTLTNLFGQNLFTKITTIILTLILWIIVFISLINSLPIDT
jgi:hypothetical protein